MRGLTNRDLAIDANGVVYITGGATIAGGWYSSGNTLISRLIDSDKTLTIAIGKGKGNYENDASSANATNGKGSNTSINFDPTQNVGDTPMYIVLRHEMIHADRSMRGVAIDYSVTAKNPGQKNQVPKEELATVGLKYNKKGDITENMLRAEHKLKKRKSY